MKKIRMLLRVSSDQQLEADGDLSIQRKILIEYIQRHEDWILDSKEYFEGSKSAYKNTSSQREVLQEILEDARKKEFDILVPYKDDRVGRLMWDTPLYIMSLKGLGVDVFTVKGGCISPEADDIMGQMMLTFRYANAQKSSADTGMRVKDTAQKLVEQGKFMGGKAPFGYELAYSGEVSKHGRALKHLVIVPEQAEIVKQIFADTLAGKSTHEIAKRLNEQGVATKKGGRWTPGTINGIIGNEKYTGDVLFQKTYTDSSFNRHQNRGEADQYLMQDHHEAIITREEYELANAVLKQRGREKGNGHDTGRYQNRYGFSGRIYCGECGGKYKRRLHYKPSGQYAAWICVTHLEDKERCSQKYITDDALKLAFVTMMNKRSSDSRWCCVLFCKACGG